MAIAIALILITAASVVFYLLSPWHLSPLASNWGAIDTTVLISFWVTGTVFVILVIFLAAAIIHYRYDKNRRAAYEPENRKLELWLTLVSTLGIAALLAPGLFVWSDFVRVPDDAHQVEVVGSQWHWMFRYPGEDGEFGRVHAQFVSDNNPLGLDPNHSAGQDDIVIDRPVVYLPVDDPVEMRLRSRDVIHNFMVPNFRSKMDALPGQISRFWFTPTETGEFQSVCAQHCGIAHFAMRASVRVVEHEQFAEWLSDQPEFADILALDAGDPEIGESLYQPCIACHGPQGKGNRERNAPGIAGMNTHYLVRQLENFKNRARGGNAEDPYGQQMAPFADMLDNEEMHHVAAYINNLPSEAAESTVDGDSDRGRRLYRSCSHCHGQQGQGRPAVNAPRLAGMNDWYLVTQLTNFRNGVRGRHPDDPYGNQMVDMSQFLSDEQSIQDVVAYINTFPVAGETSAQPDRDEAEE